MDTAMQTRFAGLEDRQATIPQAGMVRGMGASSQRACDGNEQSGSRAMPLGPAMAQHNLHVDPSLLPPRIPALVEGIDPQFGTGALPDKSAATTTFKEVHVADMRRAPCSGGAMGMWERGDSYQASARQGGAGGPIRETRAIRHDQQESQAAAPLPGIHALTSGAETFARASTPFEGMMGGYRRMSTITETPSRAGIFSGSRTWSGPQMDRIPMPGTFDRVHGRVVPAPFPSQSQQAGPNYWYTNRTGPAEDGFDVSLSARKRKFGSIEQSAPPGFVVHYGADGPTRGPFPLHSEQERLIPSRSKKAVPAIEVDAAQKFATQIERVSRKSSANSGASLGSALSPNAIPSGFLKRVESADLAASGKKIASELPSNFCHACWRSNRCIAMLVCSNIKKRSCRKSVCVRCFTRFNWKMPTTDAERDVWQCCHCLNECPPKAQCEVYKRTNEKRKAKRQASCADVPDAPASNEVVDSPVKAEK
ncbi:hypothetical protein FVE85_5510 [Porphyridium purpureum]|uniref:Zinc-finger domain-containing protein n=1 Tax=Porphyridium purpureum TaxID=35688 RepID=A0A5J4Z3N1_PORPP|nr:hypothetical protein FVE85_5510 [Porphyridium purpureum]|eukprot:POR5197..scf295_1